MSFRILTMFLVVLGGAVTVSGSAFAQRRMPPKSKGHMTMPPPQGWNFTEPDSAQGPHTRIDKETIRFSACLNARIFVLLDWSGSVADYEENIVNALSSFIDSLSASWERELFFEIISFGDEHKVLAELTNQREELDLALNFLRTSRADSSTTLMAPALMEVVLTLNEIEAEEEEEFEDREIHNIVIVVSDGHVTEADAPKARLMADLLDSKNVRIYGLNTGSSVVDELFMTNISNSGYFKSSIGDLAKVLEQLDPCF